MNVNIITGPMGSGKTQRLINEYKHFQRVGFNCYVFKPKSDTRTRSKILSRSNEAIDAIEIDKLKDIFEKHIAFGSKDVCVFIDEIHFFKDSNTDLIIFIDYINNLSFSSIVNLSMSGLLRDYNNNLFPIFEDDTLFNEIKAEINHSLLCKKCEYCDKKATNHIRIYSNNKNQDLHQAQIIESGWDDKYKAVCDWCWCS
jgi:thymidine kinase